jgi:phosphatidylserine/phosphatidylglycerophosphate/cardiolipin synthase-like enzyme
MAPTAEDFMLPAKDETDDVKFLAPARKDNRIEPLVDGSRIFPALEEAIANATDTVYCTFWSIYPDTPLLSSRVKSALSVKDWQGLLLKVVQEHKVKLRMILSDFDPVNDNKRHRDKAWNMFNKMVEGAKKAGLTKDAFQIMVSRHPANITGFISDRVSKKSLAKDIDAFNKTKLAGLENSPGIWESVKIVSKKLTQSSKPNLTAFPATYHQKVVIADNKTALLGGLNISDYFQDDSDHLKQPEPVHDIFCRVEGPLVGDIERFFVGRWNAETAAFNAFVTNANANGKALGFRVDDRFTISKLTLSTTTRPAAGKSVAQLHRTLSSGITSSGLSFSVQVVRDDIARAYERAVAAASDFIYLENQVMRLDDLATWIINRFKANNKLQVLLVLPVVAEEIADGTADDISMKGQQMQYDALVKLQKALGKNIGLYSPIQRKKAPAKSKLTFFGSLQIDVHCKILVVDDVFATIGSANASPRSFQLDSEINVSWFDPESVKAFREGLWKEHLGSADGKLFASWKPANYVAEWDAIAVKNTKAAKPTARQGVMIPHEPKPGTASAVIPDFLAQVGHPDQVPESATQVA